MKIKHKCYEDLWFSLVVALILLLVLLSVAENHRGDNILLNSCYHDGGKPEFHGDILYCILPDGTMYNVCALVLCTDGIV